MSPNPQKTVQVLNGRIKRRGGRLCPKRCLVKLWPWPKRCHLVTIGAAGGDRWRNFLTGEAQGDPSLGWQPLSPAREPAGLDTNNTLLGRKVLERGRGLAQGDQVLPDGRNAQNCLFRKEFSWGAELHGEYRQWNEGCKFQLAPMVKSCNCDRGGVFGKSNHCIF